MRELEINKHRAGIKKALRTVIAGTALMSVSAEAKLPAPEDKIPPYEAAGEVMARICRVVDSTFLPNSSGDQYIKQDDIKTIDTGDYSTLIVDTRIMEDNDIKTPIAYKNTKIVYEFPTRTLYVSLSEKHPGKSTQEKAIRLNADQFQAGYLLGIDPINLKCNWESVKPDAFLPDSKANYISIPPHPQADRNEFLGIIYDSLAPRNIQK